MQVLETVVDSLQNGGPEQRIIVMGDFNDTDCSVRGLVEPPSRERQSWERPSSGQKASGKDSEDAIEGTIKYHGRWEQIDHFFVSPAADAVMSIFAPPFLLEPDKAWLGEKPRRTYVGPQYNGGLSDHLPVILKLLH